MTEDFEEDVAFIKSPPLWPLWPRLPMKNLRRTEPGFEGEGHGFIFDPVTPGEEPETEEVVLYLTAVHNPVTAATKTITFANAEAVVEAGWIVD